jgi:anaphase-promoting complex subunit 1
MLSTNFNHDNTKCSAIKEGDMVNVHITSPGAVIALALIHLKTNNEAIASKLTMPQTFYSLEFVRPSFLLLKVLCKNLIMWNSI